MAAAVVAHVDDEAVAVALAGEVAVELGEAGRHHVRQVQVADASLRLRMHPGAVALHPFAVARRHFVGQGALDYDKYDVWTNARSADEVWSTYFRWLGELAATGLYDILAHPDLVKHWGRADVLRPWPEKDVRHYYDIAMEQIAASGMAIELSTAGLRKPIGELYPDRAFLEMVADAGNPVALSSDAHTPDILGYGYDQALELLSEVGITELAVFDRRTVTLEPIG